MVLVTAPSGWEPTGTQPAEAPAGDPLALTGSSLHFAPPASPDQAPSGPSAEPTEQYAASEDVDPSKTAPAPLAAEASHGGIAWTTWLTGSGVALSAAILVASLVFGGGEPEEEPASRTPTPNTEGSGLAETPPDAPAEPIGEQAQPTEENFENPPPVEEPEALASEPAAVPVEELASAEAPENRSATNEVQESEGAPPIEDAEDAAPTSLAEDKAAPAEGGKELGPDLAAAEPPNLDPTNLDPANLDLILTAESAPAPVEAPEQQQPAPQPEAPARAIDRRLAMAAVDTKLPVRLGPTDGALPSRSAAEALAEPIPMLSSQKLPLWRAADLVTTLSGAPVTLSADALRYAGVSAKTSVELRGRDQPLAELLTEALAKRRLGFETIDGQIVIVRPGAATIREATYPIDDLSEEDPEEFAELVARLLAPDLRERGVRIAAEGELLRVVGPAWVHFEVRVFCDRLRKARGLTPRGLAPELLLTTAPAIETLGPALGRSSTFSFVSWTPLCEVVDHWRRVSGLAVVVDWRLLSRADITPQTPIACGVNGKPLSEALDSVLGPIGLGWRAIGPDTIEITTTQGLAESFSIEFYPLTNDQRQRGPIDLTEQLEQRFPGAAAAYDSRSRSILLRADFPAQRQALELLRGNPLP